ncbi:uncharacterized protein LOC141614239 [Silene latifolia]|uniref:uncharacterized protein LOC141614239 n=1 Tax=Silene latifolia TaxID=37657 RepID=UPI003D7820F5
MEKLPGIETDAELKEKAVDETDLMLLMYRRDSNLVHERFAQRLKVFESKQKQKSPLKPEYLKYAEDVVRKAESLKRRANDFPVYTRSKVSRKLEPFPTEKSPMTVKSESLVKEVLSSLSEQHHEEDDEEDEEVHDEDRQDEMEDGVESDDEDGTDDVNDDDGTDDGNDDDGTDDEEDDDEDGDDDGSDVESRLKNKRLQEGGTDIDNDEENEEDDAEEKDDADEDDDADEEDESGKDNKEEADDDASG